MDIKDVENLAELAKLELSTEEKEHLLSDMESILEYVKQINEIKVEDIKSDYDLYNVWREDLPASLGLTQPQEFSKKLIIGQFPDAQDGFLKVKKIL